MPVFEPKQKATWNWSWAGIIAVAVIALAGFQFFRVNQPKVVTNEPPPFIATTGVIAEGNVDLPAADFLSFPMNFNHRVKIKGSFRTGSIAKRIECLILTADNFDRWKTGSEYQSLTKTGSVPTGRIERMIDAGNYFLVIDNRKNKEAFRLEESDFRVE